MYRPQMDSARGICNIIPTCLFAKIHHVQGTRYCFCWPTSQHHCLVLHSNLQGYLQKAVFPSLRCNPVFCLSNTSSDRRHEQSTAIYGAGPTGLLHAMLAKHYRMGDIACIDPNKFRTDFAQKDSRIWI